jgi:hypothetical protein
MNFGIPGRRFGNLRKNFEQGTFSGAVPSDDAYDLAFVNFEGNVFQRPNALRATMTESVSSQ